MNKATFKTILGLLALTLIFSVESCKKDPNSATPEYAVPTGFVTGTVTAQNSSIAIPHALVFVDDQGEIYHTYTDANGNFTLEAPSGQQMVHIQTGDGMNFRTVANANIQQDATVQLGTGSVTLQQTGNLAYITGIYDEIEAILDSLGYTATEITIQDLEDINYIAQFDAIFMNCGNIDQQTSTANAISALAWDNLNTYAINGGSLYASDWAVRYFMGEYNGGCANGRPGGFIQDSKLCTEKTGTQGWEYGAMIDNTSLSNYLGISSMDIEYDLAQWEQIVQLDTSLWETLVSSSAGDPLMIRTTLFDASSSDSSNVGNITIGNNGNQWITICHIPPGNPNNPITITISTNALQAHLNHGDSVGACNSAAGGTIYYTTFHNHPGGAPNTEMEDAMEWVILNM